jgi:hypothetical protein
VTTSLTTAKPVAEPDVRIRKALTPVTDRAGARAFAYIVLAAFVCHLVGHLHGIVHPSFLNLDVAGIVYNARLLLAGRLPYVDSIEIKPPGAFILVAPWLALGGLRAVWIVSAFWATATSVATGWLGGICWGKRWQGWICLLHAGGAVLAAEGDINYSFWMTLPLTLSAGFAAAAVVERRRTITRALWFGAGAALTFAVLIRPSAASLGLLLAAIWVYERRESTWREIGMHVLAAAVGAIAVVLLVSLPFVQNGNLEAVVSGYANVRRYANDSVASIVIGAGGRWPATFIGLQCLPEQLPLGHLLLAVAMLPLGRYGRDEDRRPRAFIAWGFGLAVLIGITLTLRFFAHDNAPLWAAYSILVLRPAGALSRLLVYARRWRAGAEMAALGLGTVATLTSLRGLIWQNRFMQNNDDRVAELCRRLEPHLGKKDSVLAWGWTAWGVYEHCHRWAPGPVYKDLTNVTTVNTNTCNRGYELMRFKQGPLADRYLADLQRGRPALILVSDYYKGMGGDPLDEWHDARIFIREHYVTIDSVGEFRALLRADLAPQLGLPMQNALPFTANGEPTVMNACGAADEFWQSVVDPERATLSEPENSGAALSLGSLGQLRGRHAQGRSRVPRRRNQSSGGSAAIAPSISARPAASAPTPRATNAAPTTVTGNDPRP